MKGDRNRKSSRFSPGSIPWNKGLQLSSMNCGDTEQKPSTSRMTAEEFSLVARPTADGGETSGNVRVLRPKVTETSALKKEDTTSCSGMRLVDCEKMSEAFNEAFQIHQQEELDCEQANIIVAEERKVGVCWKFSLKCTNCNYVTPLKKLYQEAPSPRRGPNPAAPNLGLAAGLQDTPLGNTRCRYLLANLDIPPPSKSGMQKTANKVGSAIKELNDSDMSEKVEMLKEVNRRRGDPENSINIAMDGRYNSTTISSRKKAGQNASQSIGIACETMTEKQYIIAAAVQNKLCWTGAWLRNKGYDVKCPDGHADCTASLHRNAPLSEYQLGKSIGEQLGVQEAYIKYVTTDGDARSAAGVGEAMRLLDPMWKVERQADPTHLGQAQFRHCYQANFSAGMFTAKTREKRQEQQKVFSQDIKARCSLVFKELMRIHAGDITQIKKELPSVLTATVNCYAGDCSSCRRHSYVCGGGVTNSWWNRSMYLASHKITNLFMEENDRHLVQEIIKMKLSDSAVEQMKLGTSTQKCEAVNRSISVSLPKNVNFSRNVHGRLASTIHRLNNGIADSAEKKLEHLGVHLSSGTRYSLRQMQVEEEYQKKYAKQPEKVKRRLLSKGRQLEDHLKYQAAKPSRSDYRKGQLDPVPSTSRVGNSADHSYSQ